MTECILFHILCRSPSRLDVEICWWLGAVSCMLFVMVRPPPPKMGGGAIADSQYRLGTKWGQVEVTYCRLGLGCSGWVCKGNVCIVHGMCYHIYRVFI